MKAIYKTVLRGELAKTSEWDKNPEEVYEYAFIKWEDVCCDGMKEAIDCDALGFGEFQDTILNRDNNINFSDCSLYPEGAFWHYFPIHFCPFCGAPAASIEGQRVKLRVIEKRHTQVTHETEEVPV